MGDIIWLASYPKSGNTWMRTFLHNLFMNRKEPVDINELNKFCLGEDKAEYYNHFDPRPLSTLTEEEISALRPKVHELLTQAFPDNVFVKTHSILGKSKEVDFITMELTAGAIYMLRNPLDVAISFAHHFGLTIDQSIENIGNESNATPTTDLNALQLWSSWSTNVKSWTRKPVSGLHVVRYEDLKSQPFRAFGAVAKFLGLNPPRERLRRAIANSSFKTLKAQEDERGFLERSEHTRFFRKGGAGQWREVLSDDQIKRIVSDHREQMERFDYVPSGY